MEICGYACLAKFGGHQELQYNIPSLALKCYAKCMCKVFYPIIFSSEEALSLQPDNTSTTCNLLRIHLHGCCCSCPLVWRKYVMQMWKAGCVQTIKVKSFTKCNCFNCLLGRAWASPYLVMSTWTLSVSLSWTIRHSNGACVSFFAHVPCTVWHGNGACVSFFCTRQCMLLWLLSFVRA